MAILLLNNFDNINLDGTSAIPEIGTSNVAYYNGEFRNGKFIKNENISFTEIITEASDFASISGNWCVEFDAYFPDNDFTRRTSGARDQNNVYFEIDFPGCWFYVDFICFSHDVYFSSTVSDSSGNTSTWPYPNYNPTIAGEEPWVGLGTGPGLVTIRVEMVGMSLMFYANGTLIYTYTSPINFLNVIPTFGPYLAISSSSGNTSVEIDRIYVASDLNPAPASTSRNAPAVELTTNFRDDFIGSLGTELSTHTSNGFNWYHYNEVYAVPTSTTGQLYLTGNGVGSGSPTQIGVVNNCFYYSDYVFNNISRGKISLNFTIDTATITDYEITVYNNLNPNTDYSGASPLTTSSWYKLRSTGVGAIDVTCGGSTIEDSIPLGIQYISLDPLNTTLIICLNYNRATNYERLGVRSDYNNTETLVTQPSITATGTGFGFAFSSATENDIVLNSITVTEYNENILFLYGVETLVNQMMVNVDLSGVETISDINNTPIETVETLVGNSIIVGEVSNLYGSLEIAIVKNTQLTDRIIAVESQIPQIEIIDASSTPKKITTLGNPDAAIYNDGLFVVPISGRSSLYFNTYADSLVVENSTDFNFGTTTLFTIEGWVSVPTVDAYPRPIIGRGMVNPVTNMAESWIIYLDASRFLRFCVYKTAVDNNVLVHELVSTAALTSWSHFAIVRNSVGATGISMFVNGILHRISTVEVNMNVNRGDLQIAGGASWTTNPLILDGIRITKNVARYNTTFTPPKVIDDSYANKNVLVLHADSSITDASVAANTVITDSIITDQTFKWYNNSSHRFSGYGSLTVSHNSLHDLTSGDFTLEASIYIPAHVANKKYVILAKSTGSNGWEWYLYNYKLRFEMIGVGFVETTEIVPTSQYIKIFTSRSGNTLTHSITEVMTGSITNGTTNSDTLYIGNNFSNICGFVGNIEEIRVTSGIARDTVIYGTSGISGGQLSIITNSLLGRASLIGTTSNSGDDNFWTLALPWTFTYNNVNYSTIYVGTNSYITFGGGSSNYSGLSYTNPNLPKIMISAADNSAQIIYYGIEGTSPQRTFRVRFEGTNATSGTLNSPNMVWEATFYENSTSKVDIQIGANARNLNGVSGFCSATELLPNGTFGTGLINVGYRWNTTINGTTRIDSYYPTEDTDANYSNVSLLLHVNTETINGIGNSIDSSYAPKNIFEDSISFPSTATKFGQYSIKFNSYNSGIRASDTAFAFGTGDFTIEGWVYPAVNDVLSGIGTGSIALAWSGASSSACALGIMYDNDIQKPTSIRLPINNWAHVALSRVSGICKVFVNGELVLTENLPIDCTNEIASVGALGATAIDSYVGSIANGKAIEVRITSGVGRYTNSFKAPTRRFYSTQIIDPHFSNTSLLLHGTNYTDYSSNAFTITPNQSNNIALSSTQSKSGGNSLYFDGTSASIYSAPNAALNNQWTIDFWMMCTYTDAEIIAAGYVPIFEILETVNSVVYRTCLRLTSLSVISGTGQTILNNDAFNSKNISSTNVWRHVQLVKSPTVVSDGVVLFVDGVYYGSINSNPVYLASGHTGARLTDVTVGSFYNTSIGFKGYIDEFRITADYRNIGAGYFTVPDPIASNNVLLIRSDHAGSINKTPITDISYYHNNPVSSGWVNSLKTTSGAIAKTGNGCLYFLPAAILGGTATLTFASSPVSLMEGNEWTVEFWMRASTPSNGVAQNIFDYRANYIGGKFMRKFSMALFNGVLYGGISTSNETVVMPETSYISSLVIASGTWCHIAVVYSNGDLKLYRNGNIDSSNTTTVDVPNGIFTLGGLYNGYMDSFNVYPSAKYISAFTPSITETVINDAELITTQIGSLEYYVTQLIDLEISGVVANINTGVETAIQNLWANLTSNSANGSISDVNLSKNSTVALVTAGTVFVGADYYWYNISLLLHGEPSAYGTDQKLPKYDTNLLLSSTSKSTDLYFSNTSAIVDSSEYTKTLTVNGNAQITTAQSKFGYSSIYFDGYVDSLNVVTPTYIADGPEDFTVEAWIYPQLNTGYILSSSNTSIELNNGYIVDTSGASSLVQVTLDAWQHFSIVRNAGNVTVYLNGIGGTPVYSTSTHIVTTIGSLYGGFIDELRITKGIPRYLNDYPVPTIAFGDGFIDGNGTQINCKIGTVISSVSTGTAIYGVQSIVSLNGEIEDGFDFLLGGVVSYGGTNLFSTTSTDNKSITKVSSTGQVGSVANIVFVTISINSIGTSSEIRCRISGAVPTSALTGNTITTSTGVVALLGVATGAILGIGQIGSVTTQQEYSRALASVVVPSVPYDSNDIYYANVAHLVSGNNSFVDVMGSTCSIGSGTFAEAGNPLFTYSLVSSVGKTITANTPKIENTVAIGLQDFTAECWCWTNTGSSLDFYPFKFGGLTGPFSLGIMLRTNSQIYIVAGPGATMPLQYGGEPIVPQNNTWNHLAIVRHNSIFKLYWNGVRVLQTSYANLNIGSTSIDQNIYLAIAEQATGKINDFRYTPGVARYSGNHIQISPKLGVMSFPIYYTALNSDNNAITAVGSIIAAITGNNLTQFTAYSSVGNISTRQDYTKNITSVNAIVRPGYIGTGLLDVVVGNNITSSINSITASKTADFVTKNTITCSTGTIITSQVSGVSLVGVQTTSNIGNIIDTLPITKNVINTSVGSVSAEHSYTTLSIGYAGTITTKQECFVSISGNELVVLQNNYTAATLSTTLANVFANGSVGLINAYLTNTFMNRLTTTGNVGNISTYSEKSISITGTLISTNTGGFIQSYPSDIFGNQINTQSGSLTSSLTENFAAPVTITCQVGSVTSTNFQQKAINSSGYRMLCTGSVGNINALLTVPITSEAANTNTGAITPTLTESFAASNQTILSIGELGLQNTGSVLLISSPINCYISKIFPTVIVGITGNQTNTSTGIINSKRSFGVKTITAIGNITARMDCISSIFGAAAVANIGTVRNFKYAELSGNQINVSMNNYLDVAHSLGVRSVLSTNSVEVHISIDTYPNGVQSTGNLGTVFATQTVDLTGVVNATAVNTFPDVTHSLGVRSIPIVGNVGYTRSYAISGDLAIGRVGQIGTRQAVSVKLNGNSALGLLYEEFGPDLVYMGKHYETEIPRAYIIDIRGAFSNITEFSCINNTSELITTQFYGTNAWIRLNTPGAFNNFEAHYVTEDGVQGIAYTVNQVPDGAEIYNLIQPSNTQLIFKMIGTYDNSGGNPIPFVRTYIIDVVVDYSIEKDLIGAHII